MNTILGCPRSGSSILLQTLGAHESITPHFEPRVNKHSDFGANDLTKFPLERGISDNGLPVTTAWLDKHVDKVIWIVRHPQDCTMSLIKGMRTWAHPPKPVGWKMLSGGDNTIELTSAYYWQWINGIGYGTCADTKPTLTIYYEELIKDSEAVCRDALSFLGLPESGRVLKACERITEISGENEEPNQVGWRQQHLNHIGWGSHLRIWDIVGEVAEKYGYFEWVDDDE